MSESWITHHSSLIKSMSIQTQPTTLARVLRRISALAPEDSVYRAAEMLRAGGTLPIVDSAGRLRGVVSPDDLRPLLALQEERALLSPVAQWARLPGAVGHAEMSVGEVSRVLAASGETTLFIVDEGGHYLGGVSLSDLLAPQPTPPRPASVGGMATPWGVYLTNGALQAGAGNGALIVTGVLLGLLLAGSFGLVGLLALGLERMAGWPLFALWTAPQPAHLTWQTLDWFLLQGSALPIFFVLLRLLPLSGYHAAEHQAVHAMERGEPLHPGIVRRMPRVHPRCGTNLMAGGLVFTLISQAVPAIHFLGLDAADGALLGAVVALFTWRNVGVFLQQHFTTRPATDRQIASGIAAAQELERKFLQTVPRRPTLWRRLWCMGLPQTFLGVSLGASAMLFLLEWGFHFVK